MNNQFDELTKSLAQSVTRRGALKKFGVGIAGVALAQLGLVNEARAGNWRVSCKKAKRQCGGCTGLYGCTTQTCVDYCTSLCISACTPPGSY